MADQSSPPPADVPKFKVPPEAQHLTSRRVSFRSTVSDPTLPNAYLEALEAKRRQLDESIHKYIASKEREYRNFEKDIRNQQKNAGSNGPASSLSGLTAATHATERHGTANGEETKRRSSSDSTVLSAADNSSSSSSSRKLSAIAAIVSEGMRKSRSDSNAIDDDEIWKETKAAIAGLTDRRASMERDKDFAGLFTPSYLAAIDDKAGRAILERATSDPANLGSVSEQDPQHLPPELPRASSDSAVQEGAMAKPKRPAQIQVASRTSSSGSSADGRLASALKSPTQRARPKRKRVSLAVGDSIVAPSDSVPVSELATPSLTPSHSRVRSPVRDSSAEVMANVPDVESVLVRDSRPRDMSSEDRAEQIMGKSRGVLAKVEELQEDASTSSHPRPAVGQSHVGSTHQNGMATPTPSRPPPPKIDPDGDLFDLEDEMDSEQAFDSRGKHRAAGQFDDDAFDSEDEEGIMGRLSKTELGKKKPTGSTGGDSEEDLVYDAEAGLLHESAARGDEQDSVEEGEDGAVHMEYYPQSASASQQPIQPGFRRPSVSADPIFKGSLVDYTNAERKAVDDEIYGQSFTRPASKGSFKGGSLGESFMEKNAAELLRARAARREAEVRS